MSLKMRYHNVCEKIANAAYRCGRRPEEITLVAVTKGVSWEEASEFYALGQRDFGENRVIQALETQQIAPKDCRWHFIGNLQNNKVNKVMGKFSLIHSIDTLELIKRISYQSIKHDIVTKILLQVNTSGEVTKHGMSGEQWKNCFEEVLQLPSISIQGLMTMAPLVENEKEIRHCFSSLRVLREELQALAGKQVDMPQLSMGMSHDYELAIEEGATMVRIGTALFQ